MDISIVLDPACAEAINRLGYSPEAIQVFVNGAIRRALQDAGELPKRKRYNIRTFDAGKPLFSSPEELKKLMEDIQEEEDLESLRRSDLR